MDNAIGIIVGFAVTTVAGGWWASALNPYSTGRIQLLQWLAMNDLADDGLPNLSAPRIPTSIRYLPAGTPAPPSPWRTTTTAAGVMTSA